MSVKIGLDSNEIMLELKKWLNTEETEKYKKLIEAITTVIIKNNEQVLHDLRFNKTENGKIVKVNEDDSYDVEILGTICKNLKIAKIADELKEGDLVFVEVKNNEYSQLYIKSRAAQ